MLKVIPFAFGLVASVFGTAIQAETNILFILDASNSMWGQIDNVAKIDTAKAALDSALDGLPDGVTPALMIYGHRQKNSCTDVQLVVPFGTGSRGDIKAAISGVSPRGKTPIAEALRAAAAAFAGLKGDNNNILLISDGLETCQGNPCAVAGELAQNGIELRVNVVGFDVDAKARAQLECIADKGNGRYFDAKNAGDFRDAIQMAQVAAVEKTPPPPPPPPPPEPAPKPVPKVPVVYFEDQFNGDTLGADWGVLNPDPDAYLEENGALSIVAADGTAVDYAAGVNVLRLDKPVPKGDWTMTARFSLVPQTMGEVFRIGIARDDKSSLLASVVLENRNYAATAVDIRAGKSAAGKDTGFARTMLEIDDRDILARAGKFGADVAAVEVRLVKTGRNYVAAARLQSPSGGFSGWFEVQKLTSLKLPGDAFTILFGSRSNDYTPAGGEGAVDIDWVKIEVPPK